MLRSILAAAICLGLAACGSTASNNNGGNNNIKQMDPPDSAQAFSCDTTTGSVHTCVDYAWTGSAASLMAMQSACAGTVGTSCSQMNASGGCRQTAMNNGLSVQETTWTYGGRDNDTQAACAKATGTFVPNPNYVYDPGPYPAGPYGTKPGDTLYDIHGLGYMLTPDQTDATQLTVEDIHVDVLRKNPTCTCGILSQSAIWCVPCNAEQDELRDALAADNTLCVFNVLLEDNSKPTPKKAVPSDIITWNSHMQNFPIITTNISTYLYLPTPSAIPTNVIFNPQTMEILEVDMGLKPIADIKKVCAGN